MRRTWAAVVSAIVFSVPATSWAQSTSIPRFTREVSVSAGVGHVFRYEDTTLGDHLNVGAGLGIVHRSGFGVEFEVNRTLGFAPGLAQCAIRGEFCYGTTHAGIRPPTVAAATLQYRFKGRRVQPYLTAGIGVLLSKSVRSTSPVGGPDVIHTEAEVSEAGFGPDLGAGLRLPLARGFSINSEMRWLEGAWVSQANLAVTRAVIRTAYSW